MVNRLVTTQLRIDNLCCNKEKKVVLAAMESLGADVADVKVNVVSRSAVVRHSPTVDVDLLLRMLNDKGLGATLQRNGREAAEGDAARTQCCGASASWKCACSVTTFLIIPWTLLVLSLVNGATGRFVPSHVTWLLCIGAVIFGGKDLAAKGLGSLRSLRLDMNVLMGLVVVLSLCLGHVLEAAEVTVLFSTSEHVSRAALDRVAELLRGMSGSSLPSVAHLAPDGREVPLSDVGEGTLLVVRQGELCPVDGVTTAGQASLDESSLTGESLPVMKNAGDEIFAGTLCVAGALTLEVRRIPTDEDAQVRTDAHMAAALDDSTSVKQLTMRFAQYFTPAVLLLALGSFLRLAHLGHSLPAAARLSLSLILLSCPCAVVMASPLVEAIAVAVCRRKGLLLRSAAALEGLAGCGVMAFDKTGTLTQGRFAVVDEIVVEPTPLRRAFRKAGFPKAHNASVSPLRLAASLEATSAHPLAAAVVNHYTGCVASHLAAALADPATGLLPLRDGSQAPLPHGRGLRGILLVPVDGSGRSAAELEDQPHIKCRIDVGNKDVLENCLDPDIEAFQEKHEAMAHTTIYVRVDRNEVLGLALQDMVRPSARPALNELGSMGLDLAVLSGDRPDVVRSIAAELELPLRFAHGSCTAQNKEHFVLRSSKGGVRSCAPAYGLKSGGDVEEGETEGLLSLSPAFATTSRRPSSNPWCKTRKSVVFVGDGINDEKALRAATVGVAMGVSGTGVAIDAADAVLVEDDLSVLPWALKYAQRCRRILFANLALALLIKAIVVGLAFRGWLSLGMAALSDVGGLLFVILNSLFALNDDCPNVAPARRPTPSVSDIVEAALPPGPPSRHNSLRLSEGMALLEDAHAKSIAYGSVQV